QARTITTDWHPTLFLPVQVSEPGRITRYQYDAEGRKTGETVIEN
ncbi:RHS repeat protein, partial [Pseudomonas aeruginosa]|nr:RHS repeat protein [Pseudomonas aeruginosa]